MGVSSFNRFIGALKNYNVNILPEFKKKAIFEFQTTGLKNTLFLNA